MMEYTFASTKKIHASTNLLLGGGGVSNGYYEPHQGGYGSNFSVVDESGFYVIQPSVSVEVNVTDWFRVGVGAGYRHITGSDMIAISDKEMSAPSQSFS